MTSAGSGPVSIQSRSRLGAARDLAFGVPVVLGMTAATWWLLGLAASFVWVAGGLYLSMCFLILSQVREELPGPGLGPANRVTVGRAVLAIPVLALSLFPGPLTATGAWWVIVVSTAVLILDGVDGRVARRTGSESAFGARFDMELDAALIIALSVLVWSNGRAGAWVLLIGLMRYIFVLASWVVPSLSRELPKSRRRQTVCVVQGIALLVALGPIIPAPIALLVVAVSLGLLLYSFAVDVRLLLTK
jgi:phosphatidylglycerophosphate synthase